MMDALADLYVINPARPGDILLQPQRWCHHQWQQLLFTPFDAGSSQLLQFADRIVRVFLLILPTLLSYSIGLVGIAIRLLCSESGHGALPLPAIVPVPMDPVMRHRNLARAMFAADGEQPPLSIEDNAIVQRDAPCCFTESTLGRDVIIHIVSFLRARDKVSVINVSRVFSRVAKADLLWISYLEEQRLWGGSLQWRRSYIPGVGLQFVAPEGLEQYPPAYNQLKTYYELRTTRGGGGCQLPEFINYIARLIRGGPVAFSQLPSLNNIAPEQIGSEHITHPIMYGKTGDVHLFALRIRAEGNELLTTLILSHNPRLNQWTHRGNCMPLRSLNVSDNSHMNYILRLINGERLGQIPQGFPANPQLA